MGALSKHRLSLITALLLLPVIQITMNISIVRAMPPHPNIAEKISNTAESQNSRSDEPGEPSANGLNAPSNAACLKAAIGGQFKLLAVLVEFPDTGGVVAPVFFDTLMFGDRQSTVRDYYSTVSYGELDIVTVNLPSTVGWIQAPQAYSWYVNGNRGVGSYPQNSQKLCEDIVDLLDPIIDFSQYDNDDNGTVDAVMIIHTGSGYESTGNVNDIHSHKWSITPRLKDGVYICDYTIQPEFWYQPGDMTCGVFCHELGHIFGLPDLYDTDYSSRGVGVWSLMGYGSWLGPAYDGSYPAEPDAWSRIQLGFATPVSINSNTLDVSINNIENGGEIYRLWPNGVPGNEYFLIENRQALGYDAFLPGDGLLIWHIDETRLGSMTPNNNEWYPDHAGGGNYGVALVQADGQYQLEQMITSGDSGDPFPGSSFNNSISSTTIPGSDFYDGTPSLIRVDNISPSSNSMTADLTVTGLSAVDENNDVLLPNEVILSQNYPNPFNPSTIIDIKLPRASHISLNVYDALGRKVAELLNGFYKSGDIRAEWDGTTDTGENAASGIYLYEVVTQEYRDSKKMILMK